MTEAGVWDFFDRLADDDKKAMCRLCQKVFCCSTSSNLKTHLRLKHCDQVVVQKEEPRKRYRTSHMAWKYFTKLDDPEKAAKCNFCGNVYSYKTTTHNLWTHLVNIHGDCLSVDGTQNADESETDEIYLEESEEDENSVEESTDMWGFYREISGTRVQCRLCRAVLTHGARAALRHLRQKHAELITEASGDETDNKDPEEIYTEVVYLEDEKIIKKQPPKVFNKTIDLTKSRQKRRKIYQKASTFSNEADDVIRKKQDGDELDKFGTYVISLLRSVPDEVSTKLQMDIINLIMEEKLKSQKELNKLVLDHVPMTLQTVDDPGTSYIMTVPSTSVTDIKDVVTANETEITDTTQD